MIQPQKCWLKNESCSKSVPEIGWKTLDESGLMFMDRTLVVARGPLSLCGTITISGDIADKGKEQELNLNFRNRNYLLRKEISAIPFIISM